MLDDCCVRIVERRKLRNISIPLWLKYGGGADCQHSRSRGAANRELPEQPDAGTRMELLLGMLFIHITLLRLSRSMRKKRKSHGDTVMYYLHCILSQFVIVWSDVKITSSYSQG